MNSKVASKISVALTMTALLAACSGSADEAPLNFDEPEVTKEKEDTKPEKTGTDLPAPTRREPDKSFTLTTATGEIPLALGDKASIPITVTRGADQQDTIIVSVSDLPSGVSAAPLSLSSSASSGEIVLSASSSAKVGKVNLTVRALAGTLEKTQTLTLSVQKSSSSGTTSTSKVWCNELLRCCNQMGSFFERAACLANSTVGSQDTCKVHLLGYVASGSCYVDVPSP